jgi:hypothetical protein
LQIVAEGHRIPTSQPNEMQLRQLKEFSFHLCPLTFLYMRCGISRNTQLSIRSPGKRTRHRNLTDNVHILVVRHLGAPPEKLMKSRIAAKKIEWMSFGSRRALTNTNFRIPCYHLLQATLCIFSLQGTSSAVWTCYTSQDMWK